MELFIALFSLFISVLVAILFWYYSPDPLERRVRRFFGRLRGRHPAEAVKRDIAVFGGCVELLTDELLARPADAPRKQKFYEMAPLAWDIISAHADIERDQQASVIEQLREPIDSLRFVCIRGESGSGKSTLAWRVAAELHERHRAVVICVTKNEDPAVWYRMAEFCHRVGGHLYVLADDLFRNAEVRRALEQLDPWLPLTVLATSQTNEYRPGRLKGEVILVPLKSPSPEEKKHVLRGLGLDLGDLNPEQLRRFKAANEFLVLMVELTSGKGFHEVIQNSLDNLLRLHKPVYRAYEYLCFSYSYGVAIPASVLERLDDEGGYYELPKQKGAQGLVFPDERSPELVRPGHPRRANAAREFFEKERSPAIVLRKLVKVIDVSGQSERRFIASLLRNLAYERAKVVEAALPYIEQEVAKFFQHASEISELNIWRRFYLALDRYDEAGQCVDAALAVEPVSTVDCNLLLNLYRARGRERDALPVLDRWIRKQPEWGGCAPAYLGLVERYGTENEQEAAIDETSAWLAAHPDDTNVRAAYLGLVERKGTPEQTVLVLEETSEWLAAHPDDANVRAVYLGLMARRGRPEQTVLALEEASEWLAAHPNNAQVRTVYLGLVARRGRPEQIERALEETSKWLEEHPDDDQVRQTEHALGSGPRRRRRRKRRNGTPEQTERALEKTSKRLAARPDNSAVRAKYLGLVECKGTPEQTERALEEASEWLAEHPNNTDMRTTYLGLVARRGTPEQTERALEETSKWLEEHPDDANVRMAYLGLVGRKGTDEQIERVLKEMPDWLREHPHATEVWDRFISYLCTVEKFDAAQELLQEAVRLYRGNFNIVIRYLSSMHDRLDEARIRNLYASFFESFPRDSDIQQSWARWLQSHGDTKEAEKVFSALTAKHPRSYSHWYGYGRLLLDAERYEEAKNKFRQVLDIHRGHAMAHDGLAQALQGLARCAEEAADHSGAARLFNEAESEFKSAIRWAGINQDPQAIFYNLL